MADRDFNWNSAVILLNADSKLGGAQPILGSSGSLSQTMSHSINYDSRQHEFEEKGGIDRDLTESDKELMESESYEMVRQLDYVSRMASFADKGKDEMIDCSFFGQDGPLSREGIEEQLKIDGQNGGCFYRSVLSVNREVAGQLGLATKQDFENLLRDTWTDSVLKWGITDNPNEVRWFANYHTDQPNNLHVHITTWFSQDLFKRVGWQVPAPAWRQQREIINRVAYRPIMREHLQDKDYLRDLAIIRARQELHLPIKPEDIARLERKREKLGHEPLPQPSLSQSSQRKLDADLAQLRAEYGSGYGRISRNYMLQSAGRNVVDRLYEESPTFKTVIDHYRNEVNILADRKGLGVPNPSADPAKMQDSALKFTLIERNKFISQQMDDLKMRIVRPLIVSAIPQERERELVQDIAKQSITFKEVTLALQLEVGALGLNKEQIATIAQTQNIPHEQRLEVINNMILKSPYIQNQMLQTAQKLESKRSPEEQRNSVERIFKNRISLVVKKVDLDKSREKGIAREIKAEQKQIPTRNLIKETISTKGINIGMSLKAHGVFKDMLELAKDTYRVGNTQSFDQACKQAATQIVSSPTMQRAIENGTRQLSSRIGITHTEARSMLVQRLTERFNRSIKNYCKASVDYEHSSQTQVQSRNLNQVADTSRTPTMMRNGAADLISAAVNGLMREANRQQRRRQDIERESFMPEQHIQRKRNR